MASLLTQTEDQPSSPKPHPNPTNPTNPEPLSPSNNGGESGSNSPDDSRKTNGRRARFSAVEDLIIVREVAAVKAHVAPYGQTQVLFEKVAERCNGSREMKAVVKGKQCQDRYLRLQEAYDKEDGITHLRSGIGGGQLSELNELLSQMKEARDDMRQQKTAQKEKVAKDEEQKERIGRDLVAASLSRRRKLGSDYISGDDSDGSSNGSAKKNKRRKTRNTGMGGDLAAFGDSLRDSDLSRIELEREQLHFERHKFDVSKEERQKDREERRIEREENNKLELEKLKAMLSAFRGSK